MEKKKNSSEKKEVTPFFKKMIKVYFDFYEKNFEETPSFDGSAPRDLKNILDAMRKRSTDKGFEWSETLSEMMLNKFLEYALQEKWLKDNFFLFNLNRQKDKIFLKIKNQINGTSKEGFTRDGLAAEFSRRYPRQRDVQPGTGQ